jgi:hypothetical protein
MLQERRATLDEDRATVSQFREALQGASRELDEHVEELVA